MKPRTTYQPLQEKSRLLQATFWNLPRFGGRILLLFLFPSQSHAQTPRAMNVPAVRSMFSEEEGGSGCHIVETGLMD
jgi:hypothetical protein